MFVGCPSIGRGEGLAELRMMLWDISFSLTAPRRKGVISCELCSVTTGA